MSVQSMAWKSPLGVQEVAPSTAGSAAGSGSGSVAGSGSEAGSGSAAGSDSASDIKMRN